MLVKESSSPLQKLCVQLQSGDADSQIEYAVTQGEETGEVRSELSRHCRAQPRLENLQFTVVVHRGGWPNML